MSRNNVEILNALRLSASGDYKERIPVATQENLGKIAEIILEYPSVRNEFIDTLTNKLVKSVFVQKTMKNKLKMFHRGELPYGQTIESVFIDIIKAKNENENFGDSEASSLLGVESNSNVKVEYYQENFKHKYKVSTSNNQLKSAVMSSHGLMNLVNGILKSPLNSAEIDEYLIMKALIDNGEYTTIECEEPVDSSTTKNFAKKIKLYIKKLGFASNKYNKQGVTTYSNPDELVLITTPEYEAELDIELFATAFNIEKAEINSRVVLIDEFADKDRLAVLIDKDFIQFYETENTTENFRNADKLVTNTFLHRWGLATQCKFANAIEFRKSTATESINELKLENVKLENEDLKVEVEEVKLKDVNIELDVKEKNKSNKNKEK